MAERPPKKMKMAVVAQAPGLRGQASRLPHDFGFACGRGAEDFRDKGKNL
jgi:hypothetical protein